MGSFQFFNSGTSYLPIYRAKTFSAFASKHSQSRNDPYFALLQLEALRL